MIAEQDASRSGLGMFAAAGAFLLLVGFSTAMAAPFWSTRTAIFLVVAAIGAPRLIMLLRTAARPVAVAGLVFIGWAAVSTALSGDRTMAVLGRYDQGTGLVFVVGIVSVWALGCSLPGSGRRLVQRAVLAGALVNAAIAVLQTVFDLSSLHLQNAEGRAAGLLGNPVHLGAISAAALALVAPRLQLDRLRPDASAMAWAGAAVLLATAVQLSGSRSGLIVALGLLLWALAAFGWRPAAALAVTVVIGLAVGGALASGSGGRTAAGRAGETDVATASTGEPRLLTWRSSIGAIAER